MYALTIINLYNLIIFQIIEILLVLYSIHLVFQDESKFLFYFNNYID